MELNFHIMKINKKCFFVCSCFVCCLDFSILSCYEWNLRDLRLDTRKGLENWHRKKKCYFLVSKWSLSDLDTISSFLFHVVSSLPHSSCGGCCVKWMWTEFHKWKILCLLRAKRDTNLTLKIHSKHSYDLFPIFLDYLDIKLSSSW